WIREQAAVVFAVCDAVIVLIAVCAEKSTGDDRYRLLLQAEVFRDTAVTDLAYQTALPILDKNGYAVRCLRSFPAADPGHRRGSSPGNR
ncbi:MAG: hypothetical protein AB2535_22185, partial [Candidatus Thiodiazotropha endolucinida]